MQQIEKLKNYKSNWSDKPYNFFGDYLRNKYNCKVLKVPINADLGCPNRDGKIDTRGCIFCSDSGSASPSTYNSDDILKQMHNSISSFKRSDHETKYIAYFQAYTNTYSDISTLKKLYDSAISLDNIIGLMIGTRPDCINEKIANLISNYNKNNFELWVELGMQTSHDKSLNFLNRGHTNKQTVEAINLLAKYKISTCVHIILGIPGETWEDMMNTARFINKLPVNGVKIHHLHVIKNTELENLYNNKSFKTIELKEYVSTLCDFVERLRPDITIHRIAGDKESEYLVAPKWTLNKGTVQREIINEFKKRSTFQGFLLNESSDLNII